MHPDKAALRMAMLDRRRQLTRGTLLVAAARVREHVVGAVRAAGARQICLYVPFAAEPGSRIMLDALTVGGVEVLLPVRRDDLDLDWAVYTGPRSLVAVERGPAEPMGRRLGCEAVAGVDLAVVPALAVDPTGNRLGRGGGSYDRALARVPAGIPIVALLHDGELVPAVPAQPLDRAVSHTVTPTMGWRPVGAGQA